MHLYLWCFDCSKNFADVQTLTLSQPHLVFRAAITESQDFGPCWASENKLWSRRWFQIFFMFTPKIGENSHFDYFFKWAETINRWSNPDLFHEVVIFKTSECGWVFPMNDETHQLCFTTMLLFLYLLSLKHPKTRIILENRPSQQESNNSQPAILRDKLLVWGWVFDMLAELASATSTVQLRGSCFCWFGIVAAREKVGATVWGWWPENPSGKDRLPSTSFEGPCMAIFRECSSIVNYCGHGTWTIWYPFPNEDVNLMLLPLYMLLVGTLAIKIHQPSHLLYWCEGEISRTSWKCKRFSSFSLTRVSLWMCTCTLWWNYIT